VCPSFKGLLFCYQKPLGRLQILVSSRVLLQFITFSVRESFCRAREVEVVEFMLRVAHPGSSEVFVSVGRNQGEQNETGQNGIRERKCLRILAGCRPWPTNFCRRRRCSDLSRAPPPPWTCPGRAVPSSGCSCPPGWPTETMVRSRPSNRRDPL
jgi:hypothetical protein